MSEAIVVRRRLNFFERYLSLWVALCMVAGVLLGKLVPVDELCRAGLDLTAVGVRPLARIPAKRRTPRHVE